MHIHSQKGTKKEHHRLTYKQLVNKSSFSYQREKYKTALPQCLLKKLYEVTTALEKSNKHKQNVGIKKLKGLYYKAFWGPEFIEHRRDEKAIESYEQRNTSNDDKHKIFQTRLNVFLCVLSYLRN